MRIRHLWSIKADDLGLWRTVEFWVSYSDQPMRKIGNSYEVNSNRRHIDIWSHLGRSDPLFVNHSFKSCQKQILLGRSDPLFVNHSFKSCWEQILLGWNDPLFVNHSFKSCQKEILLGRSDPLFLSHSPKSCLKPCFL